MLDFELLKYCYGCTACVNACSRGAIRMIQAVDGSYVPQIDRNLCIGCGKCDRVCIHQHASCSHTPIAAEGCYAAYQLDEVERKSSTSGGMFFTLAREILQQGGFVCGCVWNDQMDAVHIVSNKLEDIERMRNSKYVQSDMGSCLAEVQQLLKIGKIVMFCGTPCQCVACGAVVGDSENLLKVSLICEGVPTTGVWRRYREAKAKEYGEKIRTVNFRSKDPVGWSLPYYVITTESGKKQMELSYKENAYVLGMLQGLIYRQSCYHCEFKGSNGSADLIIGDLWKVGNRLLNMSANKGISALIINTKKGEKWIERVTDAIYMEEYPIDTVRVNNSPLECAAEENASRIKFFAKLDAIPIEENLNQNIVLGNRKKNFVTKVLIRMRLYKPLWKVVHLLRDR